MKKQFYISHASHLNDIWCYLFTGCFHWKIGVFQQNVVRVYYILKGATKLQTKVIFMSATKIGENTTNILKLLFFLINLHSVKSNQPSTYGKLNLPLTSSISFVFLPLGMEKKTRTDQSIPHVFFTLSEKERSTNLYKWQLQKLFLPVCMWLLQLASINVFYSMW